VQGQSQERGGEDAEWAGAAREVPYFRSARRNFSSNFLPKGKNIQAASMRPLYPVSLSRFMSLYRFLAESCPNLKAGSCDAISRRPALMGYAKVPRISFNGFSALNEFTGPSGKAQPHRFKRSTFRPVR
jgi:hypothetical protein